MSEWRDKVFSLEGLTLGAVAASVLAGVFLWAGGSLLGWVSGDENVATDENVAADPAGATTQTATSTSVVEPIDRSDGSPQPILISALDEGTFELWVSEEGHLLTHGSTGLIRRFDVDAGVEVSAPVGRSTRYAPDLWVIDDDLVALNYATSTSESEPLYLYNLANSSVYSINSGQRNFVRELAYLGDGQAVTTGYNHYQRNDTSAHIVNIDNPNVRPIDIPTSVDTWWGIETVVSLNEGRFALTGHGEIEIWHVDGPTLLDRFAGSGGLWELGPDLLGVRTFDDIALWDTSAVPAEALRRISHPELLEAFVDAEGRLVTVGGPYIQVWELNSNTGAVSTIGPGFGNFDAAIGLPNGYIVASMSGSIGLWDPSVPESPLWTIATKGFNPLVLVGDLLVYSDNVSTGDDVWGSDLYKVDLS